MQDYSKLPLEEKQALVQKAYDRGFYYESTFSNCGQCTLAALSDVFPDLGIDDKIFKSAFALGGGFGQSTLGTCGALSGAGMAISLLLGRERSDMAHGTQECFDAAYEVYCKFVEKFGGCRCHDVQTCLFGTCYRFREEGQLDGYLASGGHDKCGTVVGTAAALVAQLIVDGKLNK